MAETEDQKQAPVAEEEKFQLGPSRENAFQPTKVKAVVEDVLKTELAGMTFDGNEQVKMSSELSSKISARLKGAFTGQGICDIIPMCI